MAHAVGIAFTAATGRQAFSRPGGRHRIAPFVSAEGQDMTTKLSDSTVTAETAVLRRRVRVALGQEPGDLLLTGGQVVNVFTGRIEPADVIVADGWIAGVGPFA